MPTSSPSYILRTPRHGCYYFRMKVPVDLQDCLGKRELRASLRTGFLTDAKSKSRLIAGRVQKLFRKIRITAKDNYDMTKLDQAKINDIIKSFIKDSFDKEEDMRRQIVRARTRFKRTR